MALFGFNKSSTTNETNYHLTDQSANAAEGAIAIGAGGVMTTVDDKIALGSINAQRETAAHAIDSNKDLSLGAINTVAGLAEISARERQDVLNTTTTALQSQAGLSAKIAELSDKALERSQTPDSAVTKQLLWVVGAVAIVAVLALFGNKRKAS